MMPKEERERRRARRRLRRRRSLFRPFALNGSRAANAASKLVAVAENGLRLRRSVGRRKIHNDCFACTERLTD